MSEAKVVKKGQYLFKAGDKIATVFVIQAGQVNLCTHKNNKILDIMTVGNGYVFADLVVFDPRTVADRATYEDPHRLSVGIERVIVNGVEVFADGQAVESAGPELPGRALRFNA